MASNSKCVHCGEVVYEWTQDCPKCGRPVANRDAPVVSDLKSRFKKPGQHRKKSMLPYLLAVVIIVIVFIIYYMR
jgi:uncharacterized membrane protein YvbJ